MRVIFFLLLFSFWSQAFDLFKGNPRAKTISELLGIPLDEASLATTQLDKTLRKLAIRAANSAKATYGSLTDGDLNYISEARRIMTSEVKWRLYQTLIRYRTLKLGEEQRFKLAFAANDIDFIIQFDETTLDSYTDEEKKKIGRIYRFFSFLNQKLIQKNNFGFTKHLENGLIFSFLEFMNEQLADQVEKTASATKLVFDYFKENYAQLGFIENPFSEGHQMELKKEFEELYDSREVKNKDILLGCERLFISYLTEKIDSNSSTTHFEDHQSSAPLGEKLVWRTTEERQRKNVVSGTYKTLRSLIGVGCATALGFAIASYVPSSVTNPYLKHHDEAASSTVVDDAIKSAKTNTKATGMAQPTIPAKHASKWLED